jgi:uncharacterized protein
MGAMRLLFWCFIGWLLYAGLRRLYGASGGAGRGPAAAPPSEEMVRCAACGLNLPKSEALAAGAGWACCAGHVRDGGGGP